MKCQWVLVLVVLVSLISCTTGKVSISSEEEIMNLNLQTWVGHGPIYLAQHKGFFKEQGLTVNIIPDEIAQNRNEAFKQGLLDAEGSSIDLLINKRDQGVPVSALFIIDESVGADGIVSKETILSVDDLRGKTIAVERKNVGEAFLTYVLHSHDIPLSDVTLLPVGGSDEAAQTLLANQVDAAVTWEPWLTTVRQSSSGHRVLLTSEDVPGVIIDIFVVREDYLHQNPESVKKFLKGWFKALDYIKENPEESMAYMASVYNLDPDLYKETLQGLKWPTYEENLVALREGGNIPLIYDELSTIFLEAGAISTQVSSQDAIKSDVLETLYGGN